MEPYESKALFSYKNTPRLSAFDPDKQGVYFCSPYGVLAFEAEIVSDHGDKFAVRGLSLDAAHGIAEEPLQGLHVAAVPRDLDGMADFRTFVPKRGRTLYCMKVNDLLACSLALSPLFIALL